MEAIAEPRHAYAPGEEVVVDLTDAAGYSIERGVAVAADCLPSWTIGIVIERRTVDGTAGYVVRIEHDGCVCVCTVAERAIEGLA